MKAIDDALRDIIGSGDIPGLDAFARCLPGFNPRTDCGFCVLPMLTAQNASPFFFDAFMRIYARHYSAQDFFEAPPGQAIPACAHLLETSQFDKALLLRLLYQDFPWDKHKPGSACAPCSHYFAKYCFASNGREHCSASENLLYAEICASLSAARDPGFFLAALAADNAKLLANMAFDGALGPELIADLAIADEFSEFCARFFERGCKRKKPKPSNFDILLDLFCSCAFRSRTPKFAACAQRCLSALRSAALHERAADMEKACIIACSNEGFRPKAAASL